jgi:hypothetical protein
MCLLLLVPIFLNSIRVHMASLDCYHCAGENRLHSTSYVGSIDQCNQHPHPIVRCAFDEHWCLFAIVNGSDIEPFIISGCTSDQLIVDYPQLCDRNSVINNHTTDTNHSYIHIDRCQCATNRCNNSTFRLKTIEYSNRRYSRILLSNHHQTLTTTTGRTFIISTTNTRRTFITPPTTVNPCPSIVNDAGRSTRHLLLLPIAFYLNIL